MSRRYVYWRSPHGGAYTKGDEKHALGKLVAELTKTATLTADGQIQWQGFGALRCETQLYAALMAVSPDGVELNPEDTRSLVWEGLKGAIRKAGGGRAVPAAELLREADRAAAAFWRTPEQDYVLISALSVKDLPAIDRCLNNASL